MKYFLSYDNSGKIITIINSNDEHLQLDPTLHWVDITNFDKREELIHNSIKYKFVQNNGSIQLTAKTPDEIVKDKPKMIKQDLELRVDKLEQQVKELSNLLKK